MLLARREATNPHLTQLWLFFVFQFSIIQAWMNELLMDYSLDDFHVSQTHSAYVRLDGSVLRVAYQKAKIPKRAMWNEVMSIPNFEHQRNYNLEGAKVILLPEGLASKR